jgi:hypothetical protein
MVNSNYSYLQRFKKINIFDIQNMQTTILLKNYEQ